MRSHLWRFVLCLLMSLGAWQSSWSGQWHHHRALFWIDLAAGIGAFVLCGFRRRHPLAIALALAALLSVSALATGPAILAAVSFAARRNFGQIVLLGALMVIASQAYADTQTIDGHHGLFVSTSSGNQKESPNQPVVLEILGNVIFCAGALGWGMYLGSRRELLWTLRARVASAEAEHELRESNARVTERSRIAREMHDVLAHRISQVSMHAGAMAFRDDLTAEQLRSGIALIQSQANHALDELRSVLGVLRDPETGAPADAPQPTYRDIAALVDDAVSSGMSIECVDEVTRSSDVPDSVGRTVYRIVQEGLTNARKHAPRAVVRVVLTGSRADGVSVEIRNALGFATVSAAPGSGLGLVGLAERAALSGGRLTHRREADAFVLTAWIPWET
ncbi:two-component sensor histidine kinase [Nocardioides baekrokdamisoli]|uniref:histidine kinase n=1 Tax=Nocardioides baekrokdamisoli TaxID=1804624 RepID=A0A3G9IWI9_9ACTN|nr:histidine kinase [Nocardioides baekrokdamisoli]BBH18061.1 two-component sensor histidine kinase [Nocardioides baekrokdamisoli]